MIQTQGPPSKVMFVGDYPTALEVSNGFAFSENVGRFYANILSKFGRNLRNFYTTYFYKVPVTGYESKVKSIKENALKTVQALAPFDKIIASEIEAVNPNVIIAAGELAMQGLTGLDNITNRQGSILSILPQISLRSIKVIPILSPRKVWEQKSLPLHQTALFIYRALQFEEDETPFIPREELHIISSYEQLEEWWCRAQKGKFLTVDIETHCGFITCIGFSHDGLEAISVPLLIKTCEPTGKARIYKLLKEILASPVLKVNQNIKYDVELLEYWGFKVNNIWGDTMLMAGLIYPEFPKNLGFLTALYTLHPYYKDEGRDYDPAQHNPSRLLLYNAKDALVAHQVWTAQQKDAQDLGVASFFYKYTLPAFHTYRRLEHNGIRIDDTQRKSLLEKYQPQFQECVDYLSMLTGKEFNPLSPKQVGELVYGFLQIKERKHKTASGNESFETEEEVLEEIMVNEVSDEGIRGVIHRVILARKLHKILEFLESPISLDGRARTSYLLSGTKTGRTSGSSATIRIFGINKRGKVAEIECGYSFQTIPKHGFEYGSEYLGIDLRSIFVTDPGWTIVEGDQSQAEARIVCVLCEDWDTLNLFDTTDIHKVTAALILSKAYADITKTERQEFGKKPRHAGNFGMGAGRLSQMTHFPRKRCEALLTAFHEGWPKVHSIFHAGVKKFLTSNRRLISPHGRVRTFLGMIDDETFKEGYATIPQATVSDHNKFIVLKILCDKYCEQVARPVAEQHDSNTFLVRDEFVQNFCIDFRRAIETPINFRKCSFSRNYDLVIPGEIETSSTNWKEMQRWEG